MTSTASLEDIVATLRAGAAAVVEAGGQGAAAEEEDATGTGDLDRKALKQQVADSLTRVHLKATSVGMLWGDASRTPSKEEGSGLLSEYEQSVLHFCALCHRTVDSGGTTLREAVQASSSKVVEASCALLEALGDRKKQKHINSLTGMVWEACDVAKKMPLDDRTAVGRRMTLVASSLRDAEREAKELLQEQKAPDEDDVDPEEKVCSDDDDDDLDFDADELSPEERAVAGAGLELVQAMIIALKDLIKAILTQDFPSEPSSVARMEAALQSIIATGRSTEDVVAGLYGPQDAADIGQSLEGVRRNWGAVMEGLLDFSAYSASLSEGGALVEGKLSHMQASLSEP